LNIGKTAKAKLKSRSLQFQMPKRASLRASKAKTKAEIPQVGTDMPEKGQIAAADALKYAQGRLAHLGLKRAITAKFPRRWKMLAWEKWKSSAPYHGSPPPKALLGTAMQSSSRKREGSRFFTFSFSTPSSSPYGFSK
jgi:hypothetical protein